MYDAFNEMNLHGNYIILRNFEEISNDCYYMAGHDDIDFLCDRQKEIVKALDARKNNFWGSQDHFLVKIAGYNVKFGLRYIGDGYYDSYWEEEMLENKVLRDAHYYVMQDRDYFYSLLYHALLQKKTLSDDYRIRLRDMGTRIGMKLEEYTDFERVLFHFLNERKYTVPYPKDPTVPVHYEHVPESFLRGYAEWRLRKIFYIPRKMAGKAFRRILRK